MNSFDRLGIIVDREENDPPDPSGARELECHLTLAAKLVERHTAVATVIVKVETKPRGSAEVSSALISQTNRDARAWAVFVR